MNLQIISVKHEGIDILYNEEKNHWEVDDETHGITLSKQSLAEVRKSLVQALKSRGKGRFVKFKAWMKKQWGFTENYTLVMVTSLVEDSFGNNEAWISYSETSKTSTQTLRRMKVSIRELYRDTAKNKEYIKMINKLRLEVTKLDEKADKIEEKLEQVKVKKDSKSGNKEGE